MAPTKSRTRVSVETTAASAAPTRKASASSFPWALSGLVVVGAAALSLLDTNSEDEITEEMPKPTPELVRVGPRMTKDYVHLIMFHEDKEYVFEGLVVPQGTLGTINIQAPCGQLLASGCTYSSLASSIANTLACIVFASTSEPPRVRRELTNEIYAVIAAHVDKLYRAHGWFEHPVPHGTMSVKVTDNQLHCRYFNGGRVEPDFRRLVKWYGPNKCELVDPSNGSITWWTNSYRAGTIKNWATALAPALFSKVDLTEEDRELVSDAFIRLWCDAVESTRPKE